MQKSVVQRVCCTKNNCSRLRCFSCKNVKMEVKLQDPQNYQSRLLSVTDDITGVFSFLNYSVRMVRVLFCCQHRDKVESRHLCEQITSDDTNAAALTSAGGLSRRDDESQ